MINSLQINVSWFLYSRDVCLLQQELKEKEKADTELGKETNKVRDEVCTMLLLSPCVCSLFQ